MKYIRTKDGRIAEIKENMVVKVCDDATRLVYKKEPYLCVLNGDDDILKQADTIEELCDELVVVQKDFHDLLNADTHCLQTLKRYYEIRKIEVLGIYGAIWTDKGLIYVAKMNDKGELELL